MATPTSLFLRGAKATETVLALLIAQMLVFGLPFRVTARLFHLHRPGEATQTGATDPVGAIIGVRVKRVANRLPWKSTCLVRAIAGALLLARRGVASHIRFGVRKENDRLAAHAWLMVGDATVLGGGDEIRSYVPIADLASS